MAAENFLKVTRSASRVIALRKIYKGDKGKGVWVRIVSAPLKGLGRGTPDHMAFDISFEKS